jgi:hypothetical protein
MTTTTTSLRQLLIDAIRDVDRDARDNPIDAPETKAAAVALVLGWIQQTEGAFHPHDPGHVTDGYGAPLALERLVDEQPWLANAWRRQMARQMLADAVIAAVVNGSEDRPYGDSTISVLVCGSVKDALSDIASASELLSSGHPMSDPMTGDDLDALVRIANGEG